MHPLSDKDLDRLSREAAEQYDVEQNTSGWDKLEQKLSKHMPEKGKKERRRFLLFIWLFALLSGGGLLWMLTGNNNPRLITLKEGSSKPNLPITADESTTRTSSNNNKRVDVTVPADRTTADKTASDRKTEIPDAGSLSKSPGGVSANENQVRDRESSAVDQSISRNQNRMKGKTGNPQKKSATSNSSGQPEDQGKKIHQPIPGIDRTQNDKIPSNSPVQPPVSTPEPNKLNADQSKQTPNETKQVPVEQVNPVTTEKKTAIPKTSSWFRRGLEVGLVAAPDMSNVKFTNTDKIGFNAGLQLGYRFADRWSVNAGVLYTRKNYTAEGRDFSPPKGTWLDNVKLDAVEGYCNMFDIPVNIRYDLTTGSKHRYFASTGISSYLMKKEDYHYYYQYANGTPGYRHRSGSSTEQHLGSIVNISAGIEKQLGKHLSIQGEPYFKVPLTGLGFGNLKLNSYGVYFSVKYHTR